MFLAPTFLQVCCVSIDFKWPEEAKTPEKHIVLIGGIVHLGFQRAHALSSQEGGLLS